MLHRLDKSVHVYIEIVSLPLRKEQGKAIGIGEFRVGTRGKIVRWSFKIGN